MEIQSGAQQRRNGSSYSSIGQQITLSFQQGALLLDGPDALLLKFWITFVHSHGTFMPFMISHLIVLFNFFLKIIIISYYMLKNLDTRWINNEL